MTRETTPSRAAGELITISSLSLGENQRACKKARGAGWAEDSQQQCLPRGHEVIMLPQFFYSFVNCLVDLSKGAAEMNPVFPVPHKRREGAIITPGLKEEGASRGG